MLTLFSAEIFLSINNTNVIQHQNAAKSMKYPVGTTTMIQLAPKNFKPELDVKLIEFENSCHENGK